MLISDNIGRIHMGRLANFSILPRWQSDMSPVLSQATCTACYLIRSKTYRIVFNTHWKTTLRIIALES